MSKYFVLMQKKLFFFDVTLSITIYLMYTVLRYKRWIMPFRINWLSRATVVGGVSKLLHGNI